MWEADSMRTSGYKEKQSKKLLLCSNHRRANAALSRAYCLWYHQGNASAMMHISLVFFWPFLLVLAVQQVLLCTSSSIEIYSGQSTFLHFKHVWKFSVHFLFINSLAVHGFGSLVWSWLVKGAKFGRKNLREWQILEFDFFILSFFALLFPIYNDCKLKRGAHHFCDTISQIKCRSLQLSVPTSWNNMNCRCFRATINYHATAADLSDVPMCQVSRVSSYDTIEPWERRLLTGD
jgi:hypothetical protein